VIKSRILRWTGHVARIGDRKCARRVLVGKPKIQDYLEDTGVDGRIILKWILGKWDGGEGMAEDRDRRRPLVNAAMNIRIP
jgi:hypothetical protein